MKSILIISLALTSTTLIMLSSCRSTDTDSNLSGGTTSVDINLLGSQFVDESPEAEASVNSKSALTYNGVQRHYTILDPSTVLTAELSSEPLQKRAGISTSGSDAAGIPLKNGSMFRVIAYRGNGQYHTHQDYIVGTKGLPLMLDNSKPYTIIAYSFGLPTLPVITESEKGLLSDAQTLYDTDKTDFMYQSQSLTPKDAQTTLSLMLEHRITAVISTKIIAVALGDIDYIKKASIGPHYQSGTISLSNNGYITGTGASSKIPLPAFTKIDGTSQISSGPDPNIGIGINSGGVTKGTFDATLSIGNVEKTFEGIPFKLAPGTRKKLTIRFDKCVAMILEKPRAFMCHDLGADTSANPFEPSKRLHGAKYQWGKKSPAATAAQDQQYGPGVDFPSWPEEYAPDTAWLKGSKGTEDPCPTGYRVPSPDEMSSLISSNTVSSSTPWIAGSYTAGVTVRNTTIGGTIFLPAAGYRTFYRPGRLNDLGLYTLIWTGAYNSYIAKNAFRFEYSPSGSRVLSIEKNTGHSVRCIAE